MSDLLTSMRAARATKKADLDALLATTTPTPADASRADRLIAEIRDLDGRITGQAEADARQDIAERARFEFFGARTESGADIVNTRNTSSTYASTRAVYTAEASARGERSYLVDLYRGQVLHDPAAMQRLGEHGTTVPQELRDASTANVAGFTPPAYLTGLFAEAAKAGRPTANLCTSAPLPPTGMSVNMGRITTATTIAAQNGENTAVSNTDPDDTLLTNSIRTYAGYADLSRQAVERGELVDQVVMADLATSYNAALNSAVVNGDGNNGTHLGIRNIVGINTTTYTDGTPTVGELMPKIADAVGKVMSQRYSGPTGIVMHPRLWAWALGQVDSDGRPLIVPTGAGPNNAAGIASGVDYNGTAGYLFGVPVTLDGTLPVNLGAGTNETCIIVADFRDLYLFEDNGGAPQQLRVDQVLADQLSLRFVAYGYSALAAGRQPSAISVVTGTGLILT
jgi:HK97 family phage major capsid protein